MKNNLIYLAIMAMMISFNACEKEGDESEPSYEPKDAPVLVSKVTSSMDSDYGNSKSIRNHVYDEENKLITTYLSYQYFRDGEMVHDDKDTIIYVYNEYNKVTEIIRTGTNWPHTNKYTYNGNQIDMLETYFNGEEYVENYRKESIIDADDNVIEEKYFYWDHSTNDWFENRTFTVNEWRDGNKIKTYGYNPNSEKSATMFDIKVKRPTYKSIADTVTEYEVNYTYTDKISPNAYSSVNVYDNYRNLLLSYVGTVADERYTWKADYTYEYADNGFPLKETEVFEFVFFVEGGEDNVNTETYTTEYEYIDLK